MIFMRMGDDDASDLVAPLHGERGVGIIRIEFPNAPNSRNDSLEEISWDEFFKQFDDHKLALIFDEKSNFNKLVSRDSTK